MLFRSMRHLLSAADLDRAGALALLDVAEQMAATQAREIKKLPTLRGRTVVNLFFEDSTRTRISFEAAAKRLSADVITFSAKGSSVSKGESLKDTALTLQAMGADAVVLRHPQIGSAQEAAKASPVPVINAGDGAGDHPTQALLDVFTIREELGTVSGLTVTLLGDLRYGRTTHSLVELLALYGVTLNFVAPAGLEMPEAIKRSLSKKGIRQYETSNIEEVISSTDGE